MMSSIIYIGLFIAHLTVSFGHNLWKPRTNSSQATLIYIPCSTIFYMNPPFLTLFGSMPCSAMLFDRWPYLFVTCIFFRKRLPNLYQSALSWPVTWRQAWMFYSRSVATEEFLPDTPLVDFSREPLGCHPKDWVVNWQTLDLAGLTYLSGAELIGGQPYIPCIPYISKVSKSQLVSPNKVCQTRPKAVGTCWHRICFRKRPKKVSDMLGTGNAKWSKWWQCMNLNLAHLFLNIGLLSSPLENLRSSLRTGLCSSLLEAAGGQQGTRRRRGRHIYGRSHESSGRLLLQPHPGILHKTEATLFNSKFHNDHNVYYLFFFCHCHFKVPSCSISLLFSRTMVPDDDDKVQDMDELDWAKPRLPSRQLPTWTPVMLKEIWSQYN